MVSTLRESIGRQALIALSKQYGSVTEAIMELVDNPFDYRQGGHLTVEVTIDKKAKGLIRVLDFGGLGLNDRGLSEWIRWGEGVEHKATDIGQYHVGGKLAAIYLAEEIDIVCRRKGETAVWRFRDPHWGTRTALLEDGDVSLLTHGEACQLVPQLGNAIGDGVGFASVTLRKLKPHRHEPAVLIATLADTYRTLLDEEECNIRVDGEVVKPLTIPESSVHGPIEIRSTKLPAGVTVRGRIWVMDRDRIPAGRGIRIPAGIRTVFNGRLVTRGEEFGHYLAGRGQLQRLIGEIAIQHFSPNTTKTDWDKDSLQWSAIHDFMHDQMQPVVAFLNQLGESRPVPRDQRKRAERVRQRVQTALRRLAAEGVEGSHGLKGETDARGGRKPPSPPSGEIGPRKSNGHERGKVRERTPPPESAVGRLLRRYSSGVPRIDFEPLGKGLRSQWRESGDRRVIVVNMSFPMYQRIGETDDYIFETVVLHLLGEGEDPLVYADARRRLDELVWAAEEEDAVAG